MATTMPGQPSHGPVTTSVASTSDAWPAGLIWGWHFVFRVFWMMAMRVADGVLDVNNNWYIGVAVVFTAVTAVTFPPVISVTTAAAWVLLPYLDLLYHHVTYVIPNFLRTVEDIRRCRFDTSQHYWVAHCHCAKCKGTPVGLVGAKRMGDDTLELIRMCVKPELRGQGIARSLCNQASEFARSAGYQEIHLLTLGMFTPAVNLYRKSGYELVGAMDYPHSLFPIRGNQIVKLVKKCEEVPVQDVGEAASASK